MARCDAGYFCHICGRHVDAVTESDLYLRYVLGEVAFEELFMAPDAHISCNPALAQYITDPGYAPDPELAAAQLPIELGKDTRPPEETAAREARVTAAWRRLQQVPGSGWPIQDYPLP